MSSYQRKNLLYAAWFMLHVVLISCHMSTSRIDAGCEGEDRTCHDTHSSKDTESDMDSDTDTAECYLYLAPSSIPAAGMGVFTTKSFRKGSTIQSSDYGPLIPIIDGHDVHDHWIGLFNNYIWGQYDGASDQLWYEAESVTDIQPGLGIFPNFHTYLLNLGLETPPVDSLTYPTSQGPGLGAVSDYIGRGFVAERDIVAGDELFLDYSEQYLDDRSPEMDFVPRRTDFEMAAGIMQSLYSEIGLNSDHRHSENDTKGEHLVNVYETEKSLLLLRQSLQETLPRVASLLPQTFTEFENIISLGKSLGSSFDRKDERSPYAVAVAKSNLFQRDVKWIKENGICLDNIKAGDSVITDAGRGAKARRKIEKGDLIAPMPLLHIRDESELNTYVIHTDQDGNFLLDKNEKKGSQLLLNYCFGGLESSLLLCPTTNGILVNHCSDECKSPNAELKWSADETTQNWLNLSLTEINEKTSRGLSFDLVATRDIGVNEEIFIDYGGAWYDAWLKHVSDWSNFKERNSNMNSDQFTACHYWEEEDGEDVVLGREHVGPDWTQLEDSILLKLFGADGSKYEMHKEGSFWPCSVLAADRNDKTKTTFTVRIFQSLWHDRTSWEEKNLPRILTNYPAHSVKSFFKPYHSPMHSPGAFRRSIDLPSGMIPKHWHNDFGNVDSPKAQFNVGDRVEVRTKETGEWLPGTVINEESTEILLDDISIIEVDIDPRDLRWPTMNLQLDASLHPFF